MEVSISTPTKLFFPQLSLTKMDIVDYYLAVAPGALRGCRDRPTTLYRWPNGVDAPDDAFYQKRESHSPGPSGSAASPFISPAGAPRRCLPSRTRRASCGR